MSIELPDTGPTRRLHKYSIVPILGAIAFVLGYGGLGIGRDTTPRIHDLRNPEACLDCHVSHEDLTLVAEEPALCYRCHEDSVAHGSSHPIDIAVPDHDDPLLPLNKDGKMNCSTCHDAHGKANYPLLMRRTGNALCIGCHKSVGHDAHGTPRTKRDKGDKR